MSWVCGCFVETMSQVNTGCSSYQAFGHLMSDVETSCHLCRAWGYLARGTRHAEASCCFWAVCRPLGDFRKVHGASRVRPLVWKQLELGGAGSQGVAKAGRSVLARLMDSSHLVPSYACWLGRGSQQGIDGDCQCFCPQRALPWPSRHSPKASEFSSSPYVPGAF